MHCRIYNHQYSNILDGCMDSFSHYRLCRYSLLQCLPCLLSLSLSVAVFYFSNADEAVISTHCRFSSLALSCLSSHACRLPLDPLVLLPFFLFLSKTLSTLVSSATTFFLTHCHAGNFATPRFSSSSPSIFNLATVAHGKLS